MRESSKDKEETKEPLLSLIAHVAEDPVFIKDVYYFGDVPEKVTKTELREISQNLKEHFMLDFGSDEIKDVVSQC